MTGRKIPRVLTPIVGNVCYCPKSADPHLKHGTVIMELTGGMDPEVAEKIAEEAPDPEAWLRDHGFRDHAPG